MDNSTESQFINKLSLLHASNAKVGLMTKVEYSQLIDDLKQASAVSTSKNNRQYYILSRYMFYMNSSDTLITIFNVYQKFIQLKI